MKLPCISCKGSDPRNCGRTYCPIIAKYEGVKKANKESAKKDYQGPAPAPFVGHYGYPNVNVGLLSITQPTPDAGRFDDPRRWAKENTQLPELIELRSSLVNAHVKAHIKHQDAFTQLAQETAMAKNPVDVEIHLAKEPTARLQTDAFTAPTGPRATLVQARLTQNQTITTKVEKVFADTDWKAKDAIRYLYKHSVDENSLSRMLSVGVMGSKALRKMVPTRWSITATDDMLAQEVIKELYDFNEVGYQAYTGSHLGNYYLILTLPGPWSYELFETYQPNTSWNLFNDEQAFSTDYEGPYGRAEYASETAGGYYAARLPIVEELKKIKRVGSIIALRVITGEYAVPMGVWVVREAVRNTMQNKPLEFADEKLLFDYARIRLKKFFNVNADIFFKQSLLLKERKQQSRLSLWNSHPQTRKSETFGTKSSVFHKL